MRAHEGSLPDIEVPSDEAQPRDATVRTAALACAFFIRFCELASFTARIGTIFRRLARIKTISPRSRCVVTPRGV
jgi:hypothetical protein